MNIVILSYQKVLFESATAFDVELFVSEVLMPLPTAPAQPGDVVSISKKSIKNQKHGASPAPDHAISAAGFNAQSITQSNEKTNKQIEPQKPANSFKPAGALHKVPDERGAVSGKFPAA